ncbi:hypothetical protein C8T65DRAFT_697896 [Cerioporus squamosus]|nr:hypothetical protein C8T65DRAFT_697896 [Cerioporus squamosus]
MSQPFDQAEALRWVIEATRYAGGYHAHTSIALPLSAKELHFDAEGAHMGGAFEVSRTGARGSEDVLVDIQADYHREQVLQEAAVYHMHSEDEKHGVRIFRRAGHERMSMFSNNAIQFHIHVRLPSSSPNDAHILRMNALSTDLPLFSHHLHRFGESVHFDRVTLRTSQCPIDAELLAARTASLSTSNGEIRGTFRTSELLKVDTSNARVSVDAALTSGGDAEVSQLVIQTSNGPIQANISLASGAPLADASKFDVVAHTTNGPVTVAFVEQTANSRVIASLQTTNAPASVKMHPAFEGQFKLRSSPFLPPTVIESRVEDRAGHGRVRRITKQVVGPGMVAGSVAWGASAADEQRHGRVEVQTANAPLQFSL